MTKINIEIIRKLREATGAPVIRVKKVLDEVGGDYDRASKILMEEDFAKVAKREGRETSQGLVETYVHHSGKIACLVEVLCETDFVARNDVFKTLAHDLALQIASSEAKTSEELLAEEFIKDPSKKVADLIKEVIVKTGENVRLGRFFKLELGK